MKKITTVALFLITSLSAFANNLVKFYENYKVGYKNEIGQIIVNAIYEAGSDFNDGYALVIYNGKRGYIDASGKEFISLLYDDATLFSDEGIATVKFAGKYGFINKRGEWIIQPVYENAYMFSNGLARIVKDNKYGFINTSGNMVIPPIYTFANDFTAGLSAVCLDNKFGFINPKGETVIDFKYDAATNIAADGKAKARINNEWIFINNKGKKVGEVPKHPEEIERDEQRKEMNKRK